MGITVDAEGLRRRSIPCWPTPARPALDVPVLLTEPAVTHGDALAAAIAANWMSAAGSSQAAGSRSKISADLIGGSSPSERWRTAAGAHRSNGRRANLLRPIADRVAIAPANATFA